MPTLSGAQLTLLRTHPHSFKEYLAVLQPDTVLACQLNGEPSGDPVTSITFDNVTQGAFGDVVPGMTLWVGSAAGGRDKGTCRARKAATSDTLYIAEDSAIDWADDDYLTVVENYELWVKYPRIVANDSITFYKDWEETYSDQHEKWPPVAIMGPPDCQFIDGGVATCEFVGEHSYPVAPGASIASYAWAFPGGTPATASTAGTDASPHQVTWDTAGIYWVTLTVTDSNGKTHTGRRPVFIFERTGASVPYTKFKMTGRHGDLDQHGHAATFEVYGDADQAEFPDGALVVYFTEDWYGTTQTSIGGNYTGRAHIKFVGYIQKESTTKDPQTSVVTFEAATLNALMDTREGFSCWIKNKGGASNWTEATHLTADRAALSLCRHQSTLLAICDVIISGDTEYIKSQEFAAKTTLLQQLQTLYNDLFAHVACDKQGRLYFDIDPQMRPVADRSSIDVILDLAHGDWRDRLDLPRPQEPRTSFINLGGVHYAGHPHEVEPILSKAPGDAPGYGGHSLEINGLILASQADGNEKAGLALARDNNEFPEITVPMAGSWDVFDIVPQEYVRLSLAASDTKRGIVWTNQKLIPRRVELTTEETKAGRVPRVTIHVEKDSYGPSGVVGDYPEEPPSGPTNPPAPPPPTPPPGGYEGDAGPAVASHDEDGIYWTDFLGQAWEARNTGLGDTAVLDLIWDPWWFTEYRSGGRDPADVILWCCGQGFVEKSIDAGLTWEDRTPTTDPPNTWEDTTPPTATTVTYKQLHADVHNIDTFYLLVEWQEPDSGFDKWRGWIAKTEDNGASWTWYALTICAQGVTVTFDFDESPGGWISLDEVNTRYIEDHDLEYDHYWGWKAISPPMNGWAGTNAGSLEVAGDFCVHDEQAHAADVYYPQFVTIDNLYFSWHVSTIQYWTYNVYIYYRKSTGDPWTQIYNSNKLAWNVDFTGVGDSYQIRVRVYQHNHAGSVLQLVRFDNTYMGPDELRPLAMDLDTEDGTRLYVTLWADGELYARQLAAADLSLQQQSGFGSAAEAEVETKTYFIVPRCPHILGGSGYGDQVWVMGRWNDGAVKHLAKSENGGTSFTDKGSASWDSNHRVGALEVLYDGTTVHAFVNHATTPRLWQSLDGGGSWSDINSLPFNVEFEGLTRCNWAADEFLIGSNAAGAQMAAWLPAPYTGAWTDATGSPSLPTASGAISSIIWVG